MINFPFTSLDKRQPEGIRREENQRRKEDKIYFGFCPWHNFSDHIRSIDFSNDLEHWQWETILADWRLVYTWKNFQKEIYINMEKLFKLKCLFPNVFLCKQTLRDDLKFWKSLKVKQNWKCPPNNLFLILSFKFP